MPRQYILTVNDDLAAQIDWRLERGWKFGWWIDLDMELETTPGSAGSKMSSRLGGTYRLERLPLTETGDT